MKQSQAMIPRDDRECERAFSTQSSPSEMWHSQRIPVSLSPDSTLDCGACQSLMLDVDDRSSSTTLVSYDLLLKILTNDTQVMSTYRIFSSHQNEGRSLIKASRAVHVDHVCLLGFSPSQDLCLEDDDSAVFLFWVSPSSQLDLAHTGFSRFISRLMLKDLIEFLFNHSFLSHEVGLYPCRVIQESLESSPSLAGSAMQWSTIWYDNDLCICVNIGFASNFISPHVHLRGDRDGYTQSGCSIGLYLLLWAHWRRHPQHVGPAHRRSMVDGELFYFVSQNCLQEKTSFLSELVMMCWEENYNDVRCPPPISCQSQGPWIPSVLSGRVFVDECVYLLLVCHHVDCSTMLISGPLDARFRRGRTEHVLHEWS